MAKITPRVENSTVVVKTKADSNSESPGDWWNAGTKKEMVGKLLSTVAFLKERNMRRYRRAALHARLYSNTSLMNWAGSDIASLNQAGQSTMDRPTMSVITSCVDTLNSRLTQTTPTPKFLTDNGDYKQRKLAQQMNTFIAGEFYQTKAHQLEALIQRDSGIFGSGALKIIETPDKRVGLERRLCPELLVDFNDAFNGDPRSFYETKLLAREVAMAMFPKEAGMISKAEKAYPDSGSEASQTVSNQIMVVEGWHLPSGPDKNDGLHVVACTSGDISDDVYTKNKFPFVFEHFSPDLTGFWGQGLAEQLMGTQIEINNLLKTSSRAVNLMGVPRVFLEEASKFVKAHFNNNIGMVGTYRGTPPIIVPGSTGLTPDFYENLERLVQYAYQQSGISTLSATSQKPSGLNSGAALREYDDIQSDRFTTLAKRREAFFVELAYQVIDKAKDICERDGKYQTVYPDKDGTKQINLPASKLLDDPFVIQCFDVSSLPRDPSGRLQKVTEMMQAGLVTPQEGRRLLGYPDIDQDDKLANAAEERILSQLDSIVEDGKYSGPDPFTDLMLAKTKVVQYYNLYSVSKLESKRCQLLRDYYSQVMALIQAATPPPIPQPQPSPQAYPQPAPQNEMIPNVPQ